MINIKPKVALSLLTCAFSVFGLNAEAETSKQELAAISKIISLSKDIPSGNAEFGIVFDASSPASVADKDALLALLGSSYKAPKHTFTVKEIAAADAGNASTPIVFLTEGLSDATQKAALDYAKANKALTVTTSLPYVEAGNCVLGVDVGGSVKIIMHGDSYKASNLTFDAAFEFMVKEI